jgi:putative SOS response-associated peptidase YedK
MVAILDEAEFDRWLDADPAQARSMLAPYPADRLVAEPAPRPPARGPAARPAAG